MIYTSVSSSDLADLAVAIRYEDDGKTMLRDLRRGLKAAAKPAETAAKSSIMSMPSTGLRGKGGSMRRAIAKEIKTATTLGKHSAGVKVKVARKELRGFTNPAKRFNSPKGWRHPVLPFRKVGSGEGATTQALPRDQWTWVAQHSRKPGWFDDAVRSKRAGYEEAVRKAMNDAADRIARNT